MFDRSLRAPGLPTRQEPPQETNPRNSELASERARFFSPHGADFFGLDLVEDAHLARLPERINGLAQIFLRKLVDVLIRTGLRNLDDAAANLQITIGVRRI